MSAAKSLTVVTPHGFCSGVARAVQTAAAVISHFKGETVYCLNEIVHNKQVVTRLTDFGMVFVKEVREVPEGSLLLFSAHGVAPAVRRVAETRRLRVIDATCPFVTKVHAEVRRFSELGATVVCIGHRRHEEVVGVAGEAPAHVRVVESVSEAEALSVSDHVPVAVVTQTTLGEEQVDSVMAVLRKRFPRLQVPPSTDVCYATRNRQQAVSMLAQRCDRVIVLGSANSSNSQRLVETARLKGTQAVLVSDTAQLCEWEWDSVTAAGVTSGASTPESFLNEAVLALRQQFGFPEPEWLTAVEEDSPVFTLPALPV
jgi:4-hydroxy-3-methylbut-2-enyl diphosphate reductase